MSQQEETIGVMADQQEPIEAEKATAKSYGKENVFSLLSFAILAAFLFYLFQVKSTTWEQEVEQSQQYADSLAHLLQAQQAELINLREEALEEVGAITQNKFDAFDGGDFRVYGLFRDENRELTISQVAKKFHIGNTSAIKSNDVLGERWFIVPVKGLHLYQEDENLGEVAKLYYHDAADSALITQFNPVISHGRQLFIPFDN